MKKLDLDVVVVVFKKNKVMKEKIIKLMLDSLEMFLHGCLFIIGVAIFGVAFLYTLDMIFGGRPILGFSLLAILAYVFILIVNLILTLINDNKKD